MSALRITIGVLVGLIGLCFAFLIQLTTDPGTWPSAYQVEWAQKDAQRWVQLNKDIRGLDAQRKTNVITFPSVYLRGIEGRTYGVVRYDTKEKGVVIWGSSYGSFLTFDSHQIFPAR